MDGCIDRYKEQVVVLTYKTPGILHALGTHLCSDLRAICAFATLGITRERICLRNCTPQRRNNVLIVF